MASSKDKVFIGVGGHAVAIDAATGEEVWRTKLKGNAMTTVWLANEQLFAGCAGELFKVDPATGSILWHNKLKGLGLGLVAFPASVDAAAAAAAAAQKRAAAATA